MDDVTSDLPGVPRRRGRPATGNAKNAAQRQAARRARLAAEGKESLTVDVSADVADALRALVRFKADEDMSKAVDRILRSYLLRKR
jgi:hypothetical protein